MSESRPNNDRETGVEAEDMQLVACDCISYSYFSLAFLLFVSGSILTVVSLEQEEEDLDANLSAVSAFGRFWLVGPLFICSGLMVAVKTLAYLRKKSLIAFLTRERHLLQEIRTPSRNSWCNSITSRPSLFSLPPSYETVLETPAYPNRAQSEREDSIEPPPPTYEEALLVDDNAKVVGKQVTIKRSL